MAKKPKYLYQLPGGYRYNYTDALAKRSDMVTYDPKKKTEGVPDQNEVQAPEGFLTKLRACQTRQHIMTLVKTELGVDMELKRRTADMKKDAKEIFKARARLRKIAETDDAIAQEETDLENDDANKAYAEKMAAVKASEEAARKAEEAAREKEDAAEKKLAEADQKLAEADKVLNDAKKKAADKGGEK